MKAIVVSGINIFAGGPLKIMQDCLESLSLFVGDEYLIVALVHDEKLYATYNNVRYMVFPRSRKSWLYRLYYEYIGFWNLSRKLKPYCWFSLHDVTPNVSAEKRMVYCHNPFPFYNPGLKKLWEQPSIYLFSIFSRYIYQINIKKNDHVILQQQWIRDAFKKMYAIDNITVAIPAHDPNPHDELKHTFPNKNSGKTLFFYPSRAMIHKNFEVICKAVSLLEKKGVKNMEVMITIDGTENKYTRGLYKKYSSLKSLRFVGLLKREQMNDYYRQCDCLIFPSKVETWGLPLTEAMEHGKPILVSNLPYAKETIGKYDRVKFFDPDNAVQLAERMISFSHGEIVYDPTAKVIYDKPFARNWEELFHLTLEDK